MRRRATQRLRPDLERFEERTLLSQGWAMTPLANSTVPFAQAGGPATTGIPRLVRLLQHGAMHLPGRLQTSTLALGPDSGRAGN